LDDRAAAQKTALKYGVKVPLVYTTVSLKRWGAFQRLGIRNATSPGMYHTGMRLEVPTVIGGYDPTRNRRTTRSWSA
jgi:spermidine dehydrogenase